MTLLLAVIMVVAMMPSMVFVADFSKDHDRISIGSGEGLELTWVNETTNTANAVTLNSDYTPDQFTPWVQNGATLTVTSGTATVTEAYTAAENNVAYQVGVSTAATLKITLNNASANGGIYYVNVLAPQGTKPTAALPTDVASYLPVGQFARGNTWGSLFADGTNKEGTTKKFLSGYSSTGVSLGAAGG